jgi:ADP-heptose:LPS heptosyltransferase
MGDENILPKKILIVHLVSNGDCLYVTAIARQIKIDYPGSHLTWIISNLCSQVLINNEYVDQVEIWPVSGVKEALFQEWLYLQNTIFSI